MYADLEMLQLILLCLQVAYFVLHIPTTLLVDSQSLVPAKYYPQPLKDLLAW
jgi:hypothetical protein